MNAFKLTPDPVTGIIAVTAAFTPTTNIHEPDSIYAQFYVLPVVGPLCYVTWCRLNQYVPANETPIAIAHDELAWSLGASPARLNRAILRLVKFHLASIAPNEPDTLRIQRRAPTLNAALLAGLAVKCPTLTNAHDEQLHTAA